MQVCRLQTCPLQALLGTSHNLRQRAVQVLLQPLGRHAGRQRRFDPVQWDGRIRMAHRCGDFGLLHGVGQLVAQALVQHRHQTRMQSLVGVVGAQSLGVAQRLG